MKEKTIIHSRMQIGIVVMDCTSFANFTKKSTYINASHPIIKLNIHATLVITLKIICLPKSSHFFDAGNDPSNYKWWERGTETVVKVIFFRNLLRKFDYINSINLPVQFGYKPC